MYRGGGFYSDPKYLRSDSRGGESRSVRAQVRGFRVAQDVLEAGEVSELATPINEITRLLATAALDLKAGRLTTPVGNNAWEKYLRVLTLAPENQEAIGEAIIGTGMILVSYIEMIEEAVEAQDFDGAQSYLNRARKVASEFRTVPEFEEILQSLYGLEAHIEQLRREATQSQVR